jgi:hypothetical protein
MFLIRGYNKHSKISLCLATAFSMQLEQRWLLLSAYSVCAPIFSASFLLGAGWIFAGYLPLLLSVSAVIVGILVLAASETPFGLTKVLAIIGILLGILSFFGFLAFYYYSQQDSEITV